jgi:2-oxoglutarate ferredoxin oxidoreductase subunit alpha
VEVYERLKPKVPPEWYIPYVDNAGGVPAMADFGSGYRYHVTGLTHDIRGFPTSLPEEIGPLIMRLYRKISQNLADIQTAEFFAADDAEIAVFAYGCVARSAKRAVREAREAGIKAGLLRPITLWPFVRNPLEKMLQTSRTIIVPEMNMGQLSREVKRVNQGAAKVLTLNKVDGTMITAAEILNQIREVA